MIWGAAHNSKVIYPEQSSEFSAHRLPSVFSRVFPPLWLEISPFLSAELWNGFCSCTWCVQTICLHLVTTAKCAQSSSEVSAGLIWSISWRHCSHVPHTEENPSTSTRIRFWGEKTPLSLDYRAFLDSKSSLHRRRSIPESDTNVSFHHSSWLRYVLMFSFGVLFCVIGAVVQQRTDCMQPVLILLIFTNLGFLVPRNFQQPNKHTEQKAKKARNPVICNMCGWRSKLTGIFLHFHGSSLGGSRRHASSFSCIIDHLSWLCREQPCRHFDSWFTCRNGLNLCAVVFLTKNKGIFSHSFLSTPLSSSMVLFGRRGPNNIRGRKKFARFSVNCASPPRKSLPSDASMAAWLWHDVCLCVSTNRRDTKFFCLRPICVFGMTCAREAHRLVSFFLNIYQTGRVSTFAPTSGVTHSKYFLEQAHCSK